MEARDRAIEGKQELVSLLGYGDNEAAAACDLVVIATPWDSAATTAKEYEDLLKGKVLVSMANALVKVGPEFQPLVPPRGSVCLLYTSPSPRDLSTSRMPSSA